MKRFLTTAILLILITSIEIVASSSKRRIHGSDDTSFLRGEIIGDTLYITQEDAYWFTSIDLCDPSDTIYMSINLVAQPGSYLNLSPGVKVVLLDSEISNMSLILQNGSSLTFRNNVIFHRSDTASVVVPQGACFRMIKSSSIL